MQRKYIKVTKEGRPSFVVLASNELFYRSLGSKIEDAEKEEIKKAFPEEVAKAFSNPANQQSLDAANAELEKVKTVLDKLKKDIKNKDAV
jgi:PHD/YefM family antitoxin component YafN of YafNO toxin-antitoxin module